MAREDGVLVPLAERVKQAVDVPVITVGKLRSPELADRIVSEGQADFIAIGRTLLADPEWPRKSSEGHLDEIRPCIACNQGCISRLFEQKDAWCTVNHETGREELFASRPERQLNLVVVGGGPGGMTAAGTAAARGHDVVLFEQSDRLGGQLFAAEAPPHRPGWRELREFQMREIERLGVDVRLGASATGSDFHELAADAAVVAIGAKPRRPGFEGDEDAHIVMSVDILLGRTEADQRVVVAGGGCTGAQTAESLAERGHHVVIVEMEDDVATDAPLDERNLMLERLDRLGVEILTNRRIRELGKDRMIVEGPEGEEILQSDTVVYCLGFEPNNGLAEELKPLVDDVRVIGDAVKARKVTEAVAEGAVAVVAIEQHTERLALLHDLALTTA